MATTLDQLGKWMSLPREHERLEFKEAKSQFDLGALYRYCVALANEGGGRLILGVSDKPPRRVVGSGAFRNPDELKNRVFEKLRFRIETEELAHPDGRVLIIQVPSRPVGTAYQVDGAYVMRSGDGTVPMTEDRLRAIFEEGKPDWLSETAKSNVLAADIVELLDTQTFFNLIKLPYPETRDGVIERLLQERLIEKESGSYRISNLCALLLARRLSEFGDLARKAPRVVVYNSTNKLDTKTDRIGVRGYAVGFENLIDFIVSQTPSNEVIQKAIREEVKMYPEIAIRELVANALIHQDFNEHGTSVMIEIFTDRIEISSPGAPFIVPDRFIDGYQSRNERLADLMRRLGICEERGSGIDRVVSNVELFQLPAPDFRAGERRTIVVLFAHKSFKEMDRNDRIRACYQHCCLRYVMNQRMMNQSLRDRFKLPESRSDAASRIIRDTVDADLIKTENPESPSKKYARYVPYWA